MAKYLVYNDKQQTIAEFNKFELAKDYAEFKKLFYLDQTIFDNEDIIIDRWRDPDVARDDHFIWYAKCKTEEIKAVEVIKSTIGFLVRSYVETKSDCWNKYDIHQAFVSNEFTNDSLFAVAIGVELLANYSVVYFRTNDLPK